MIWVMVALGGAAGAVARFGVTAAVARAAGTSVPLATALVNIGGCAAAGLLLGALAAGRLSFTVDQRALVFAGVLGGFTTFSGVGIDTLALVQEGRAATAVLNVALQIGFGLGALALGYALVRR